MVTKNITLGRNETKLLFTLESENQAIFSFKDAKRIIGTSDSSTWGTLYGLKKKKRIKQIQKGLYLLSPARSGIKGEWTEHIFKILPKLLGDKYYVGFWSALSYWGASEQIPRVTFIIITERKRNLTFDGQQIKFVTYPKERFFGYVLEKIDETGFNISTPEKTIIDSLTHPEYSGGVSEISKAIWTARERLSIVQMVDYAKKMGIRAVGLRLGYLLELLGFSKDMYESLLPNEHTGAPWLDPSATKKYSQYSTRWGLRLNVPQRTILYWKLVPT